MNLNNNNPKNEENKIWLGEDNVVRIKIGKEINKEDMYRLTADFNNYANKLQNKLKFLIDITLSPVIPGVAARKEMVLLIKDTFKKQSLVKLAIWGKGNIFRKAVTSFIITATKIKNIKYFNTEEKALKWLKEE